LDVLNHVLKNEVSHILTVTVSVEMLHALLSIVIGAQHTFSFTDYCIVLYHCILKF